MSEYKIVIVYHTLAGEFCLVNREFSDLRSPIPNEHPDRIIFASDYKRRAKMPQKPYY